MSRRRVLECMTWAGTGVLWTISGGVPRSLGIIDQALAAEPSKLTFLQKRCRERTPEIIEPRRHRLGRD
jgi:hypothetical protein